MSDPASRPSAIDLLRQARNTVASDPVRERQLRYANLPIPEHISPEVVELCGREKIVKQSQFFECPRWAGIPDTVEWHLEVKKDGFDGKLPAVPLGRYPFFLLGKNERVCDFRVDHSSISQVHCALVFHQERKCFFIVDLNSTNGVFVDGVRIERGKPVELRPPSRDAKGSEVVLGASTRKYYLKNVLNSSVRRAEAHSVQKVPTAERGDLQVKESLAEAKATNGVAGAVIAPPPDLTIGEKRQRDSEPREVACRRFRHILIKHADVAKPVSKARRNKEEPITRTRDDALALSASVRDQYLLAATAPLSATPEERFERRTQKFLEFCAAFSECGSEKKGGDLGMNEVGDFDYMDNPEFDKAAFSLAPCAISRPIETSLGIHLIFRCQPSEEVVGKGE